MPDIILCLLFIGLVVSSVCLFRVCRVLCFFCLGFVVSRVCRVYYCLSKAFVSSVCLSRVYDNTIFNIHSNVIQLVTGKLSHKGSLLLTHTDSFQIFLTIIERCFKGHKFCLSYKDFDNLVCVRVRINSIYSFLPSLNTIFVSYNNKHQISCATAKTFAQYGDL